MNVEIIIFAKSGGPFHPPLMTKQITLSDGKLVSDGSACRMDEGTARPAKFPTMKKLAACIADLKQNEAIALGAMRDGRPDTAKVVTRAKLNGAVDTIARTSEYIGYRAGQPALALLDHDRKGMSDGVRTRLDAAGGFWRALVALLPDLATVAHVVRGSTSSGITSDAGETFPDSGGQHVYILVEDGADTERFLKALHDRCWHEGYGWSIAGKAGQILQRSIIDHSVFGGERLVFEAPPKLEKGLTQDAARRAPIATEGTALNTKAACPDLNAAERRRVHVLKAEEAKRLGPDAATARAAFLNEKAAEIAGRTGMALAQAEKIAAHQADGVLLPDVQLLFDSPEFAGCTVGDVLADPERFEGATLADPREGVEYGRAKAKIMLRDNGEPMIHSFAHGGCRYALRYDADPVSLLVDEFNARYFMVNEAGKAMVYEPKHDAKLHRDYFVRSTFEDFQKLHLNRVVPVGTDADGQPIMKSAAKVWLHHKRRRQYLGGVTFDPSGQPTEEDALNLWQGFAVSPRAGSWELLRDHIISVVCNGVQEHYDYLLGWMARLVQHPAERGEVAVVMRGGEGTGKGTVANALLRLFGQHGLAIAQGAHLTGHFNAHLRDCVVLFADEAFFAGDKAHVGVLKSLITEPFLTVEAKFQNALQATNYTHLIMASNEDWVVPASLDSRRFFVLEVSDAKKDDHAWFDAIHDELANGGYQAMLYDLLRHDITRFNHRRAPVTEGLQTQRQLTLKTHDAWWSDVLHRGFAHETSLGGHYGWREQMTTEALYSSYVEFALARNDRRHVSREWFGRFMRDTGAKPIKLTVPSSAHDNDKVRAYGYDLGSLDVARKHFQEATDLRFEWPKDDVAVMDAVTGNVVEGAATGNVVPINAATKKRKSTR